MAVAHRIGQDLPDPIGSAIRAVWEGSVELGSGSRASRRELSFDFVMGDARRIVVQSFLHFAAKPHIVGFAVGIVGPRLSHD